LFFSPDRVGGRHTQTPKVEKKEKKKELTGRAKRRAQFNKRFVDVPEGQRRPGPNNQTVLQAKVAAEKEKEKAAE
jgi:small subunit ribosomal protein S30e